MKDGAGSDTSSTTEGGALTGADADKGAADVQASGQGGALTDADDKKVDKKVDAKGEKKAPTKEEQAAAEKAKAEADAKPIEVKFGDLEVDAKLADKFKTTAKELGLDSAKAQKVADLFVEARAHEEASTKLALEQQDKQWLEAMRSDKEIGGVEHKQHVLHARQALAKFGTPELTKLINGYGLSNNPELVRVFARIGKADAEDSIAGTGSESAGKDGDEAKQRKAFPKMYQRLDRERNGA